MYNTLRNTQVCIWNDYTTCGSKKKQKKEVIHKMWINRENMPCNVNENAKMQISMRKKQKQVLERQ